jgi:hypothetical protein
MFTQTENFPRVNKLYPNRKFEIAEVHTSEGWLSFTVMFSKNELLQKAQAVREQLELLKQLGFSKVALRIKKHESDATGYVSDYAISELV